MIGAATHHPRRQFADFAARPHWFLRAAICLDLTGTKGLLAPGRARFQRGRRARKLLAQQVGVNAWLKRADSSLGLLPAAGCGPFGGSCYALCLALKHPFWTGCDTHVEGSRPSIASVDVGTRCVGNAGLDLRIDGCATSFGHFCKTGPPNGHAETDPYRRINFSRPIGPALGDAWLWKSERCSAFDQHGCSGHGRTFVDTGSSSLLGGLRRVRGTAETIERAQFAGSE